MSHRPGRSQLALPIALLLAACGGAEKSGDRGKDLAKALDGKPSGTDPKEAGEGMKRLKAKADADAKKARDDELQKLTTLPSKLPTDMAEGCAEVGRALDDFKEKRLEPDALARWTATKEPDMRRLVTDCGNAQNLELAACQANALHNASVTQFGDDALGELLQACAKKYPPAAAAG